MVVALALAWAEPPAEEVVVQAAARDVADSTPASVTSIPVDERLPEGADLAAVVGSASGVALTRLGGLGDLASVSIRGSTGRQVEVQLDGVPLNPDGSGAVDLSELPLGAFRAVEVWRGASPHGLGGGAMGGVVNLVSGEGETTAAAGSVGSYGTVRFRGALGRRWRGGDLWVAGQALSTLGNFRWYDDAGTRFRQDDDRWRERENNDTLTASVHGRVRLREGPWTLTLLDAALARTEGVPGFTARPTAQVRLSAMQNLAVAQVDRAGRLPVQARVHLRVRDERLTDPADELGAAGADARSVTDALGADARVGGALGRAWVAEATAGLRQDRFGAPGDRRARGVGQARAGLRWAPSERLLGAAGLGAVGLLNQGQGSGALLPRVGVLVRPATGWSLRANAARTFRPPDPTELFGNRGTLVGRPDLRPERGIQVDASARRSASWGSADLGVFATDASDRIVWLQNAQQVAVATNLGRGTAVGLEAALTVSGLPWLDAQTNLTVQRTHNHSQVPLHDGRPLPRQPAVQLDQRTAWVGGGLRIGHTFAFTSAISTDEAGLFRQAPRGIHGLYARVAGWDGLAVELDVLNLLNTRVQRTPANPLDPDGPRAPGPLTDFVGYPLPGRTLLLTVRYGGP